MTTTMPGVIHPIPPERSEPSSRKTLVFSAYALFGPTFAFLRGASANPPSHSSRKATYDLLALAAMSFLT
jgi:hypothetical protein